jgi:hypothetical protein
MERDIRIGPLSPSLDDSTGKNINDLVPFDDDSDKMHKDYVNQNEINNGSRENHSRSALLGPQSQDLMRAEQNGCAATELAFGEGIFLYSSVLKIKCFLAEWADLQPSKYNDMYILGMTVGCITSETPDNVKFVIDHVPQFQVLPFVFLLNSSSPATMLVVISFFTHTCSNVLKVFQADIDHC